MLMFNAPKTPVRVFAISLIFGTSSLLLGGCGSAPEKDKPMADETRTGFMIVCTQDVKQCPDGSYVSRQGHRCEFAACPGDKSKNTAPKDAKAK